MKRVGAYTYAWIGGAGLCLIAAVLSISLPRRPPVEGSGAERDADVQSEAASVLTP